MTRHFSDFLSAYVDYAGFSEAPRRMHFWSGVSAVAGALRRRVWLEMGYFRWFPNMYVIFVAPPGIVSKSTTMAIAMDLLRKVPDIEFGPDIVTWPALVTAFAQSTRSFEYNGVSHIQSALTLQSSEFGNLVNPQDREMVDLLVDLWDSRQGAFKKVTKGSGNDTVENPWINLIACTTPAWIAGNFPEYMIGGGFTSRCLFVYADRKERLVAYPADQMPQGLETRRQALVHDLSHIAEVLCGPFLLTPDAKSWGETWYRFHHQSPPEALAADEARFGGYLARKQTHIHKLAMIVSASHSDSRLISAEDIAFAHAMVSDLELDMPKVFDKIGRTEESIQAERFINFVHAQPDDVSFEEAYHYIHLHFPKLRDFEAILLGAVRSGQISLITLPSGQRIRAVRPQSRPLADSELLQLATKPSPE